jgi:AcrR family transcriptional regulator
MSAQPTNGGGRRPRRPRSDGVRSRDAILHEAARLATVDGIRGLSIGRLADAVGMSKSGLFAHFGSKEELQLATIDLASGIFDEEVVARGLGAPPGAGRLRALCEAFLHHLETGVFPGGCFFASVAAELDTQPGPVRDRTLVFVSGWLELLVATVREAQSLGELSAEEDAEQLTFELHAFLLLANAQYVAGRDTKALDRARVAIERRLVAATPG